jgi:hypothetical protein
LNRLVLGVGVLLEVIAVVVEVGVVTWVTP